MNEDTPGGGTVKLPTNHAELWQACFVAENEDEAHRQAERQYDIFRRGTVEVDRLSWDGPDSTYEERYFLLPLPVVRVIGLDTDSGWDGDVLYPEWEVVPENDEQLVTYTRSISRDGRAATVQVTCLLGSLLTDYCLWTTAPGIGTAKGFGDDHWLIYPEPVPAAAQSGRAAKGGDNG